MGDAEGTMVIRAWVDPFDGGRIRARLISRQPGLGERVELAADAATVLQAVQRWLDSLSPSEPSGGD